MSIPIPSCLISKAVTDEKAYKVLLERMTYNLECGHWTCLGCSHNPPCPEPTEEQIVALEARLLKDVEEKKKGKIDETK
jgi:hypothetical protein